MPNNVDTNNKKNEYISIIYNQNNDSPKYFELKKSKLLFFIIGLPSITFIALGIGAIGLIHTSPFHLIDTYRKNTSARDNLEKSASLISQLQKSEDEKIGLMKNLELVQQQLSNFKNDESQTSPTATPTAPIVNSSVVKGSGAKSGNACPINPSTLSLFDSIQGQCNRTNPAIFNLSDFKVEINQDLINFKFNIIPAIINEEKRVGFIIVFMKNELGIQVYPSNILNSTEAHINYASGESFSTQRFRPVDASFLKPRKAGNYIFTVYIFAKNGDLINLQNIILPVKF